MTVQGSPDSDGQNQNEEEEGQRTDFLYPYVRNKEMPWYKVIIPNYIIPFIAQKKREGSKPTVRGTLYYLESMRIIPKNDLTYKRLKTALRNARRGYYLKGGKFIPPTIPMNAFTDNTRRIIKDFKDEERSLEDYIGDAINDLKTLPDGFQTLVPRWLDQKNYVEVWVEKADKATDVQRALKGRHVMIAPNRGNNSITFMHNNIERLVDQFTEKNREKIYILYLGDLDPQGWDMDRLIREDLARQTKGLKDKEGNPAGPRFIFKRIGVTEDQIKKLKLMHLTHPDPMTLAKLKKKRNVAQRFIRAFGRLFQIELEAFDLIPFKRFQKLLLAEIDKLFDQTVYDEVLALPKYSQKPREIRSQIVDALNDLIDDFKADDELEPEDEDEYDGEEEG